MSATWQAAFYGRTDLEKYKNNRILLFALQLHQDIEDIDLVATEALTDGANDKKCDLVYRDPERGKIIIAQGYWSENTARREAPANKASDLNTAVSWLLSRQYENMPINLRAAAEELESSLEMDEINSFEIWYVHNLLESENVRIELERVSETADGLIKRNFPKSIVDTITAIEVGTNVLETWYRGTQAPILVTDTFSFETYGGYKTKSENYTAYSTSIPANWLKEVFEKYDKELFSANVRDYLGSRRSDRNINYNIKETARMNPEMFWVYNNGITALVNDFTATSQDDVGLLEIKGMAIVNGAQTTGALGSLKDVDLTGVFIPARFVKCGDPKIVQDIIRYNNSQNKIEASDYRSNDRIQTRLRIEFDELPSIIYLGGRRGTGEDAIRRPRNILPSYSAGQAIAAFHQEPAIAYNERSNIWQSDNLYPRFFNNRTTARHILFAYSLMKAAELAKSALRDLGEQNRTNAQQRQWDTLRKRGATFLITSAIAATLETILDHPVTDTFRTRFQQDYDLKEATKIWEPVITIGLPFANALTGALSSGNLSKNKSVVKAAIDQFVDLMQAVRESNRATFDAFAIKVVS